MPTGQCNCGAVRFEITAPVSDLYICHCSICRRATGANGIAVVVVNKHDFRWLSGQQNCRIWSKPGHDWQTSFCSTCGSALPGANDEERMYVPAGLLDDAKLPLKVAHHIFVGSKASWDEIADAAPQSQGHINSMASKGN